MAPASGGPSRERGGHPGGGPRGVGGTRPRLASEALRPPPQDLGALKVPEQYRVAIWRGLQDLRQGHDCGAQQLVRAGGGGAGDLPRQRVMEAVHFRVRHTITIPGRAAPGATGGAAPDDWPDFGFDLPDCKARRQAIKEELTEAEAN